MTAAPILRLLLAFTGSRALVSAVELGIFTELAAGPAGRDELAARTGLHPRAAGDFLDALVALELLRRDGAGCYHNTPAAATYLDRRSPSYVGGYAQLAGHGMYPLWGGLTEALRTGRPQVPAGDFLDGYSDPVLSERFLAAMDAVNGGVADDLLGGVDWSRHDVVVDVGGARGNLVARLLAGVPDLRGVCVDLPPLEPYFARHVAAAGVADRASFVATDILAGELPPGDVLVLGHVLHCFGVGQRRELLARAYRAVRPGGLVLVYDRMVDADRAGPALSLLGSLNMLLTSEAGGEFTAVECGGWLTGAGLRPVRCRPVGALDTLLVAQRPAA